MPAPGEQHIAAAGFNPFEDVKSRLEGYTAQEIATLQSRLEKQLGPEYLSSRPGAGGSKVYYVSGEKVINLANEVFGFNGWSSTIREIQVDFADEIGTSGKYNVGLSVIVRVSLKDGAFHEDIGYGHIENCKGKAAAFEKAKKEGTTDALKRALRNFGKVLGLCVYDKDYLSKVTKMKVAPSRWDPNDLHRHSEYAPLKRQPAPEPEAPKVSVETTQSTATECDDEFGIADFDEADFGVADRDHPDEVVLETKNSASGRRSNSPMKPHQGAPPQKAISLNQQAPQVSELPSGRGQGLNNNAAVCSHNPAMTRSIAPKTPNTPSVQKLGVMPPKVQQAQAQHGQPTLARQQIPAVQQPGMGQRPGIAAQNGIGQTNGNNMGFATGRQTPTSIPLAEGPINGAHTGTGEAEPSVGFVTARAAETIQHGKNIVPEAAAFNPHLESPSIRKTAGIDHKVSKAVPREIIKAPAPQNITVQPKNNFVNPHLDQARRVGMPCANNSPLQNRNSYKPPQMAKRPNDNQVLPSIRSALNDVTTVSVNAPWETGGDPKRPKIG